MQINRLFEIVYILLDKEKVCAKELAEQFEVSTRTIYRDVETLSVAGIPIFMSKGKGGGIQLLPDFILNKAVLTEDEKTDILSSLQAIKAINFNETDTVLQKVGTLFGESNVDWIEVDFSSWYNAEKEAKIFNEIKSAILSKTMIRFTYSSGKSEKTIRVVEPIKICFKGMARYLYAYCTLREDYRFFKLNRIKGIEVMKEHFERKKIESIFKNNTMFQEEHTMLKLKISSDMSFRVYDEFEDYELQEDGDFVVQTSYPSGHLFPYIASFGRYCEVLEPLEVRKFFREELQKTINNYL